MIGDAAASLIRDVFGVPSLLRELPRISGRVVAWGEGAWGEGSHPNPLPHSAVVLSEEMLLESLGGPADDVSPAAFAPDFTIYASGTLPSIVAQHSFGSRRASAARVSLPRNTGDCCIEALDDGWLFLVPGAFESGWLLAIGASFESLLTHSRLIAPRISQLEILPGEFSACPRIASPLCGANWLVCGTAALAFDPICGDGTGQAVREAILAAAVIRAIANGGDADALFGHYQTRLLAGMQRHLALCSGYYRSGGSGPWWKAELGALLEGVHWCGERLARAPEPRYHLRGFELTLRNDSAPDAAGPALRPTMI